MPFPDEMTDLELDDAIIMNDLSSELTDESDDLFDEYKTRNPDDWHIRSFSQLQSILIQERLDEAADEAERELS